MTNSEYREWLIEQIIIDSKYRFTRESLEHKSIRSLEIIFDNLCIWKERRPWYKNPINPIKSPTTARIVKTPNADNLPMKLQQQKRTDTALKQLSQALTVKKLADTWKL